MEVVFSFFCKMTYLLILVRDVQDYIPLYPAKIWNIPFHCFLRSVFTCLFMKMLKFHDEH